VSAFASSLRFRVAASRGESRDQSGFRSRSIVSGGGEVVGALGGCEGVEQLADGGPKAFDAALGGLAQKGLELGDPEGGEAYTFSMGSKSGL
jgi:hypothetical protein